MPKLNKMTESWDIKPLEYEKESSYAEADTSEDKMCVYIFYLYGEKYFPNSEKATGYQHGMMKRVVVPDAVSTEIKTRKVELNEQNDTIKRILSEGEFNEKYRKSTGSIGIVQLNDDKFGPDDYLIKGTVTALEKNPFLYKIDKNKTIKEIFKELQKMFHEINYDGQTSLEVSIVLSKGEEAKKVVKLYPYDTKNTFGNYFNVLADKGASDKKFIEENVSLHVNIRDSKQHIEKY